jgi:putative flippase GtrA
MRTGITATLDRATLLQFALYGLSGSAAAATLLLVLIVLTELGNVPSTLASALAFVCALPVNYILQHRFVFNKSSGHILFFTRYVTVTLLTLALNTCLFWMLTELGGIFYVASQVITLGLVVPVNFVANKMFTFADLNLSST